jgi:protein-S-isoprenylcysteine O-methyltransferase Ste14
MTFPRLLFKIRGFAPLPWLLGGLYFARFKPLPAVIGLIMMTGGELIRLWGVSYAGGMTRTRNVGGNFLVTNGPFAFIRNPLYTGNILIYTGAAVLANVPLAWFPLVVLAWFSLQYQVIIRAEEARLTELFGGEYTRYSLAVPRFIPNLKPYQSENPVTPNLRKAYRSERSTFLAFGLFLILYIVKTQGLISN